jgi:hypothetical protein
LESSISSVIFEIIGQEESVGDAAFEVRKLNIGRSTLPYWTSRKNSLELIDLSTQYPV